MARTNSQALALLAVVLLSVAAGSRAQDAPAPSSGPLNFTAILEKGGQFKTLIRLVTQTQVAAQIDNQLNSSTEGLTVLAPTDNAFDNLKAGQLNGLSNQDQVNLLLFHVLPKFYTLDMLLSVSNPVRTQYSQDGLNFTSQSRQLNVSSGLSHTQLNNFLREEFPLSVYVIDVVLLPPSLYGAKAPSSPPPPPPKAAANGTSNATSSAAAPSSNDTSPAAASVSTALLLLALLAASMLSA